MSRQILFKPRCPDCSKSKYLIIHHLISKKLVKYLIEIGKFDRGDIIALRNQLVVKICKDCENKFHTGEFYNA